MRNPADIRQQGTEAYTKIAETLFSDDSFSAYLFAVALPAVGDQADEIAEKMIQIDQMSEKPVFFLWTGRKETDQEDPAYEKVRKNCTLYYDAARCMDAIKSVLNPKDYGERVPELEESSTGSGEAVGWQESVQLLEDELPIVEHRVVESLEEAENFASKTGYPVVLKTEGDSNPHRTEEGGVATGVTSDRLESSFENILSLSEDGKVVVQEQAEGLELLVSAREEEIFGPVVTVAPGGIHAEAYSGHQLTFVAPVTREEAERRIQGTLLHDLLTGRKEYDMEAVSDLVSSIGGLLEEKELKEIEINPVIVGEAGLDCVDLLVRK